jgi:hypothetical protein
MSIREVNMNSLWPGRYLNVVILDFSHSGGVVGFASDTSCYFGFASAKQPVVAKSVGEAELIAHNKVGDLIEWASEMHDELGYPQDKVPMLVDSTCAMQMLKQGTGSLRGQSTSRFDIFG